MKLNFNTVPGMQEFLVMTQKSLLVLYYVHEKLNDDLKVMLLWHTEVMAQNFVFCYGMIQQVAYLALSKITLVCVQICIYYYVRIICYIQYVWCTPVG